MSLVHDKNPTSSSTLSMTCRRRRNALREALSVFRTDWIKDHLMGLSPTTDAAILSSPLQQLHSIAFDSDLNFGSLDQTHHSTMSCESVMIPAFSTNGWSAGYYLAETYGVGSDEFVYCFNGATLQHFVLRENDGTFISLTRDPRVDLLMYLKVKHRTHYFYCFAFPPHTFTSLINAKIYEISPYERALLANIYSETTRQCSICGVSGYQPCVCTILFKTSKTPLDLPAIKDNIVQTHVGQAVGEGLYEVFCDGVLKTAIPVGTQNRFMHAAKHGTSKKLLSWAISDVLRSTPVAISRAIASPFSPNHSSEIINSNSQWNVHTSPVGNEDYLRITPATPDISPESIQLENSLNYLEQTLNVTDPPFVVLNHNLSPRAPMKGTDLTNSSPVEGLLSIPSHAVHPTIDVALASVAKLNQVAPSRAVPIAPRGGMVPVATQPIITEMNVEELKKTMEQLRAWRLEQRKIRNRESAARSNRIRKQERSESVRRKRRNQTGKRRT